MEIKVIVFGYLGRAQRPAPLKEKLFWELATGNFIFLVIAMSYKSHPRIMKIKWAKGGQCPPYKAGRQLL